MHVENKRKNEVTTSTLTSNAIAVSKASVVLRPILIFLKLSAGLKALSTSYECNFAAKVVRRTNSNIMFNVQRLVLLFPFPKSSCIAHCKYATCGACKVSGALTATGYWERYNKDADVCFP